MAENIPELLFQNFADPQIPSKISEIHVRDKALWKCSTTNKTAWENKWFHVRTAIRLNSFVASKLNTQVKAN